MIVPRTQCVHCVTTIGYVEIYSLCVLYQHSLLYILFMVEITIGNTFVLYVIPADLHKYQDMHTCTVPIWPFERDSKAVLGGEKTKHLLNLLCTQLQEILKYSLHACCSEKCSLHCRACTCLHFINHLSAIAVEIRLKQCIFPINVLFSDRAFCCLSQQFVLDVCT